MKQYDIVIVGASFAGLAMAHHLPHKYRVLIIDQKKQMDAGVESTGLITGATYNLLKSFTDIDQFIPNQINTISVISPDYDEYFFSHTHEPWIYSTDTPKLIEHMAQTVTDNITIQTSTLFNSYAVNANNEYQVTAHCTHNGKLERIQARFIIGADGAHSHVAKSSQKLSKNKKFLGGLEKVFYGSINLGDHPENTVYHFWFGEFSLGYGGWLSPTIIEGKPAFRVGLAKLKKDIKDLRKLDDFIAILKEKNIISIEGEEKSIFTFGSLIPIGGVLKNITTEHSMLLGDAAGFCGAFAADGIKGAVVSGKIAAEIVPEYLAGNKKILTTYKSRMQEHQKLITYYRKQQLYRFIWNQMRRDSTYSAMYQLIKREKEGFIRQFCDIKDKASSLMFVVLKLRNTPQLIHYGILLLRDMIFR